MGWWSSPPRESHADAAGVARLQDTQNVIKFIFEPGNRTLTSSSTTTLHSDTTNKTVSLIEPAAGGWRSFTKKLGTWSPLSSSSSSSTLLAKEDSGALNNDFSYVSTTTLNAPSAKSTASSAASAAVSWDQLPPSPLAGYELTKLGLVDKLRTPTHTLTAAELKDLIRDLIAVEQKAKYDVDKHFAGYLGSRGLHGLELLVNPCLFLTGIYLMTWKTVRLYNTALPQDSFLFTKALSLLRRRLPASQREQLAQRHRRLMRATNAHVALSFLTGAAVLSLAWVSQPVKGVMEEAPDMKAAKEMVAYQRHAEASLKWCWYVYYHHPAYRSAGK